MEERPGWEKLEGRTPENPVELPELCNACTTKIVVLANIAPTGPWEEAIGIVALGLFRFAMATDTVRQRAEGDIENVDLILAEIGCLGCWLPHERNWLAEQIHQQGLEPVLKKVQDGEDPEG